jgi:hypothetical protein
MERLTQRRAGVPVDPPVQATTRGSILDAETQPDSMLAGTPEELQHRTDAADTMFRE